MASKKNSKKKPAKAAKTAKATKAPKAAKVKAKSAAPAAYKPRIEVGTTVEWSSQVRGEWNVKSGVVKKFLAENVDAWKHVPAKTLPSRVETRTPQSAHRRYLVASTDEKGNVHYYTPRCSTVDAWHFDEAPKSGPAKKATKAAKKAAPAAKKAKATKAKAKAEPKKAAAKAAKASKKAAPAAKKAKAAKAEIVIVTKKAKKAKAVAAAAVDTSENTPVAAADADHTDDSFTPGAAEA
jgi:hypothetical protein